MKGTLVAATVLFVLVCFTCFVILLFLPNFLWAWQTIASYAHAKPPITVQVIINPSHIPLTADHVLFSLLSSTEDSTKRSIQELLAYAAFNGQTSFTLDGVDVNIEEIVDSRMKFLAPGRSYNLFIAREYTLTHSGISIGDPNLIFNFTSVTDVCVPAGTFASLSFPKVQYMSRSTLTLPDLTKTNVVLYLG